jgi:hypothetical protein
MSWFGVGESNAAQHRPCGRTKQPPPPGRGKLAALVSPAKKQARRAGYQIAGELTCPLFTLHAPGRFSCYVCNRPGVSPNPEPQRSPAAILAICPPALASVAAFFRFAPEEFSLSNRVIPSAHQPGMRA